MGQRISVKIIPRSSQVKVEEMEEGELKIKLKAPPVDGKANEELIKVLAEYYGVSKSEVRIVKGMTGRRKLIELGN